MTVKPGAPAQDAITPLKKLTFDEVETLVKETISNKMAKDLANTDLSGLNLKLLGNGSLVGWEFSGCDLQNAILPSNVMNATFFNANLHGTNLDNVNIKDADFTNASVSGAYFWTPTLKDGKFEFANWDDGYFVGNEKRAEIEQDIRLKAGLFRTASTIYRQLKQIYQGYGLYDLAGEFYYREMECDRKYINILYKQQKNLKYFKTLIHLSLSSLTFGYGERPLRLVCTALIVWLFSASIYYFLAFIQIIV